MSLIPRLPGAGFNSSELVRCLTGLHAESGGPSGPAGNRHTLAEALSRWLAWTDAIALSGVLSGVQPGGPTDASPAAAAQAASRARLATEEVAQVRRDLLRALSQAPGAEAEIAVPTVGATPAVTDFAPYRRHYLHHQRLLAARLGPLRARVRAALAVASPALRRLAALDAVLDEALDARQRHLLGTVPALLESHFKRARRGPAPSSAALLQTVQQVLLAELETRWQPIDGMMQALARDTPPPPQAPNPTVAPSPP